MKQIRFRFDAQKVAKPDAVTAPMQRMAWILFRLLETHDVSFRSYNARFSRDPKTFARDFARVAEVGRAHGFIIDKTRSGTIRLVAGPAFVDPKCAAASMRDSLRAVHRALGEIVLREAEAASVQSNGSRDESFLVLATPRLETDSRVAEIFGDLKAAHRSRATVRFKYPRSGEYAPGAALEERTVEPHLVTYYAGRYYLVAFDGSPKARGWRQFALDRIVGTISRAGTFKLKAVPENYGGTDAIGLFKTGAGKTVTIALSERIAGAIEARHWQREQRFVRHADGSAAVTFHVYDLAEAVRWALSFAPEAHVVSPPEAVALEGRFVENLAARHVRTAFTQSA